jgi:sialidase-1
MQQIVCRKHSVNITRRLATIGALALAFACLSLSAARAQHDEAEVDKITVFQSGTDGYHTFRIPVIVKAKNGDLLAFAEGRKNGGGDEGDIDIVMKRSADNGATWSAMQLVQDEWSNPTAHVTIGNPAPVVDLLDPQHPGRIWLPFCRNNSRVFMTYSDDNGATWSNRTEITSTAKEPSWGWYATGPVHGIQLTRGANAGRLIIPSDHRVSATGGWGAHILYSSDHGQTWQIGAADSPLESHPLHPNESVAVELIDGRVYVNARDQNGTDPATRSVAYSSDGGLTFDAPFVAEPNITTPVVQNSALRFKARDEGDPRNILVYSAPGSATARRDLKILTSFDEGTTWNVETLLHEGPTAYSDMVKLDGNKIGVIYEAGDKLYDQILFAPLDLSHLLEEPWNGIHGDVDQNGQLETADLDVFVTVWNPQNQFADLGGKQRYMRGDLDMNGVSNLADVFLMRQALLSSGMSAASLQRLAAVPEPSSVLLLSVGCCGFRLSGVLWIARI